MMWVLVIIPAVAFVVLALVAGAPPEATWRQGERRGMSHKPMPLSRTALVTAFINHTSVRQVGQGAGLPRLAHEPLLPRSRGERLERGIIRIVAVYRTCPVMMVGETEEGALLELSLHDLADVQGLLPPQLWQALVEQYQVFQVG
jgi:hypothetical protein